MRAGVTAEDERDRAGPERERKARQKKYATTEKRGVEKRDTGNKPDGEFEGDGVNGNRRTRTGAREARERDWFTKRTVGERVTKAIGVEKFNCAYFRSDVSQIPRPSPPCTSTYAVASPSLASFSLRHCRSSRPLSFVLRLSFSRRKTHDICGLFFPFSLSLSLPPSPSFTPFWIGTRIQSVGGFIA